MFFHGDTILDDLSNFTSKNNDFFGGWSIPFISWEESSPVKLSCDANGFVFAQGYPPAPVAEPDFAHLDIKASCSGNKRNYVDEQGSTFKIPL